MTAKQKSKTLQVGRARICCHNLLLVSTRLHFPRRFGPTS
jgi:hypothetical protein